MDRDFLKNDGFSLVEMSLALAIAAIIALTIGCMGMQVMTQVQLTQGNSNVKAVAQACRQYYASFGHWPLQTTDLQPDFLSSTVSLQDYTLTAETNILTVSLGSNEFTVLKPNKNFS